MSSEGWKLSGHVLSSNAIHSTCVKWTLGKEGRCNMWTVYVYDEKGTGNVQGGGEVVS